MESKFRDRAEMPYQRYRKNIGGLMNGPFREIHESPVPDVKMGQDKGSNLWQISAKTQLQ